MRVPSAAVLLVLPVLAAASIITTGCSETPLEAQSPRAERPMALADSDRELLLQVLDRLDGLDARLAADVGGAAVPAPLPRAETGRVLEVEGSVCLAMEFGTAGKLESSLSLYGGADGHVGLDAYGNGGKARVTGMANQNVTMTPGGELKLTVQVCGNMVDSVTRQGGMVGGMSGEGELRSYLQQMLNSVHVDDFARSATQLRMDGPRLSRGVNFLSSMRASDTPFGAQGSGAVLDMLPLPPDLLTLVSNPRRIVDNAAQAGQYALDHLCSANMMPGEFGAKAGEACEYRNQLPSGGGLVTILDNLKTLPDVAGLQAQVQTLAGNVSGTCSHINSMRTARVTIQPRVVDFPLGIGRITTFPGYNQPVFPGLGTVC